MQNLTKLLLWVFYTLNGIHCSTKSEFTHKLIVDEDKPDQLVLLWKVVNDEIIFEVDCNTTGWIGVGLSTNGGMAGKHLKNPQKESKLLIQNFKDLTLQ